MIGDATQVGGYVTQDKFLIGRSMSELEGYLGFRTGRLSKGATFVKLTQLPDASQFELAAYSMTAQHRYSAPSGLDFAKLKTLASQAWSLAGPNRLVKVLPGIAHDPAMADDDQYPPGSGVPQWRIVYPTRLPGVVVAEPKTERDIYRPIG